MLTLIKVYSLLKQYQVTYFDEVSSTMRTIKSANKPAIHIAKSQTKGIGQYGREWLSQPEKGIYFSLRNELVLNDDQYLMAMAQLGALTMAMVLNDMGIEVGLKWPNDIYLGQKKLAGVIVEVVHFKQKHCEYILGIGLNLRAPSSISNAIGLNEVSKNIIHPDELIEAFVERWDKHVSIFSTSGLTAFHTFWCQHDYLKNKVLTVINEGVKIVGISNGIDALGQLKLADKKGVDLLFGHQASIINIG